MSKIIDFHTHVLPAIDDGSSSLKESIGMLRLEAEQGIESVVATPHFYANHDSPEAFLERRKMAQERLESEISRHEGMPRLEIGAEVHYFSGISESYVLKYLTFLQKRCILVEMPIAPWTDNMYKELENIRYKQNIIPIIAHVDRYISPFNTYNIPKRLSEMPVLVQANASFFLKPSTKLMAMRMLKNDQIHLLGSDCHNLSSRMPNLGAAIEKIEKHLGTQAIRRICRYQDELLNV